jgi:hypothetical protein
MLKPIALSIAEGCAQSPRFNVLEDWSTGVMEYWSDAFNPGTGWGACPEREPKDRFFARLASEIFFSSLQQSFSATC